MAWGSGEVSRAEACPVWLGLGRWPCAPGSSEPRSGAVTTVGSRDDWRGVRRGELPAHREKTPELCPLTRPKAPASPEPWLWGRGGHILRADWPSPARSGRRVRWAS